MSHGIGYREKWRLDGSGGTGELGLNAEEITADFRGNEGVGCEGQGWRDSILEE